MEEYGPMADEGLEVSSDIGDLSDVKDTRPVVPAASGVVVKVYKVTVQATKDGSVEKLNVVWEIVDGVEVEGEVKFKGFRFFQGGAYTNDSIFSKIDYEVKDSKWWQDRKRFLNLKNLLVACGLPVNDVKVNDELLAELTGKVLKGTIAKVPSTDKNEEGEYVPNGEYTNAVKYFKEISAEEMV